MWSEIYCIGTRRFEFVLKKKLIARNDFDFNDIFEKTLSIGIVSQTFYW